MIRLSMSVRWGIYYFGVVVTFAFLYWAAFNVNPDGFIVNQELNLTPIDDLYEHLWGTNAEIANSAPIIGLDKLQSKLRVSFTESSKINQSMDKLEAERVELENKRSLVLKKHSELMWKNVQVYEDTQKNLLLEEEANVISELDALNKRKDLFTNSKFVTEYQIHIANKRVELAEVRVKKAEIDFDVSSYILSNLGSFADTETVNQIRTIDEKLSTISVTQSEYQSRLREIRSAMHDDLQSWSSERSKILNFIDFAYYSIGISTTTTFGDITANNKWIRALVSIQLVISVIVVGCFLNAVTKS